MASLRIERDGHVLRVTLAKPGAPQRVRRRAHRRAHGGFRRRRRRARRAPRGRRPAFCAGADVEWQRASIDLSYEENVEDAMRALPHARDDRLVPGARRLLRPRLRARRRLGPRRVRGHRGRVARCGLRVHRGPARDHPRRDLAVRPPEDRRGRAALLRDRRALRRRRRRCGSGSCPRCPRTPDERGRVRSCSDILAGGPVAVREAKRLVRERPDGEETAHIAAARRTSDEGQDGLRAFLERRLRPAGSSRATS